MASKAPGLQPGVMLSEQGFGGGNGIALTGRLFSELPARVRTYQGRRQLPICMVLYGWFQLSINAAISPSPYHHTHLTPATVAVPLPIFSPSPRFTRVPHPSHCQTLVHSASPLAPWLELPSNNFISFPPLSRRHAPPLTIGCCFITVEEKKAQRSAGQVENPTIADSVLDTEQ